LAPACERMLVMTDQDLLLEAYRLMYTAATMASTYEQNRAICKYVHSTSRGHEAIQLATAFHLRPQDFVSPYYRDESILLGLGFTPYQLMLQLLAKGSDPFTGGREYYGHPNHKGGGKPTIIHQSSATGMQVIPATGIAQGIQYLEKIGRAPHGVLGAEKEPGRDAEPAVVVCSLGDASMTEGEVSEALQTAILKKLPIIYLVQDNQWGISVQSSESRAMDAYTYASGFPGLHRVRVDGSHFDESYRVMGEVVNHVRQHREPWLVQAKVPLLGHHTSGVRNEFYRDEADLVAHQNDDPLPKLESLLMERGVDAQRLRTLEQSVRESVARQFAEAVNAPEPDPGEVGSYVFLPTPITTERGDRSPKDGTKVMMVDAALHAVEDILEQYPEALFYGQDIGKRLGGVFREAATLGEKFGDHRVFNTAIQEAYIIGSTVGMTALGLKPIVEVQFADYIYPGFNQLVTEISKACYLSKGKFPQQTLIRVPIGAYGGGGPYHSGSIETTLLSIKGIKVVYPSNAADMKGLMKAAFLDPNPVVMLEHKGLYWSKVPGTEGARTIEPGPDYILPLGKGKVIQEADTKRVGEGDSCCVITYGMGVYWALGAAGKQNLQGKVEIIDLRTLFPLDEPLIFDRVKLHGKCLIITEEQQTNSFAEALAGRISQACFPWLDSPVQVMGSLDLPAVPMNMGLEAAMLPSADKLALQLVNLLNG
jgi:2-oxoisovalerate dehydrogenase E1 component